MPSGDTKILELNKYWKSNKGPFIIYAGLKCIVEKTDRCKNNPLKISLQQKYFTIPCKIFQCLKYCHLKL